MILGIYSIYDVKIDSFLPPVFMLTQAQCVRAIGECVNDPKHAFHNHAEDFSLFHLGTFDDGNAKIETNKAPMPIVTCLELKLGDANAIIGDDTQLQPDPVSGDPPVELRSVPRK